MAHKKKKPEKYPYLFDTSTVMIERGIETGDQDKAWAREYRGRVGEMVRVEAYKGSMLLSVTAFDGEQFASAWADGDDLDAVIAMLTEARRVWLSCYRAAERMVRKDIGAGALTPDSRGNTPGGRRLRRAAGKRSRTRRKK